MGFGLVCAMVAGAMTTTAAGTPSLSIVTPCYNQVEFVATTIQSVASQNYPALEYIVVDDGSTDGSAEVLQQNKQSISRIITQPNRGFGETLNTALNQTTGEIMAWINSDDYYLPGAFAAVSRVFADCPEVNWIVGASLIAYRDGNPRSIHAPKGFAKSLFFSGRYLGGHPGWSGEWIPQESVFWRRSLWEAAGARFLPERKQYGDFELWSRFWGHGDLHVLPVPLAVYRYHAEAYTAQKGDSSTEPCRKIIETTGLGNYRPWQMHWQGRLCRVSNLITRYFGEPAKVLRFDQSANKWKPETIYVM
jgi:glycosyltransferase involved in cell wall biosynthesis